MKTKNPYSDHDLINELIILSCENIEEMLDALEIDFKRYGKLIVGPCPVHGGDNPTAWNLYPEGNVIPGFWKCRSHHCENATDENGKPKWSKSLVGFVRGVLSRQRGEHTSFVDAVNWMVSFLGYKRLTDINKPDNEVLERRKFSRSISRINVEPVQKDIGWDRGRLREALQIPSQYYLDRGYSSEILDKYDVGLYNRLERIVVPVYDNKYKFVAGFLGRSIWGQCDQCKRWHNPSKECPMEGEGLRLSAKWLNSHFDSRNHLYNYWFALKHIRQDMVAILVEGSGDVWRLEENGIHISLGLFGTELSEPQRILLDQSGALSVIVMLDPDEAGEAGAIKLKRQLGRQYRMYFPNLTDDPGDLNEDIITADIQPLIDKVVMI